MDATRLKKARMEMVKKPTKICVALGKTWSQHPVSALSYVFFVFEHSSSSGTTRITSWRIARVFVAEDERGD